MERTLVLIKPDGVERKLIGEIIKRIEQADFKIIGMRFVKVDRKFAEKHYLASEEQTVGMGNKTLSATKERTGNTDEVRKLFGTEDPREIGKELRNWLIEFLTSGPVVAMVLEGEDAVKKFRDLSGFTDPSKAKKGTIRGDLGKDYIFKANSERRATKNLIHASGSREEAEREIKLWFKEKEILKS